MTTSIRLTQERSLTTIPPDPADYNYKLVTTFDQPSTGFCTQLILIKKGTTEADDSYEHICTVGDVKRYGTSRSAAPLDLYYRTSSWTQYFNSLSDLDEQMSIQKQKTQFVVTDWQVYTEGTGTVEKTDRTTISYGS